MKTQGMTVGTDGYFQRDGKRFFPVGVNYWPASSGVEMWQAWSESEIKHDLDVVRDLGLNCVRFFVRWPDFEPEFGRYDERMFERLGHLVGWCAERGILAHPALITGFMSGGFFWPKGKGSRNLYTDPLLVERSAALCRRAAAVLAPYHSDLFALDLGNELSCVDAWSAPPDAIESWCRTVTTAIREAYPEALIVSGTDSAPVFSDNGWRMDRQPGTNFLSVHTYPVPGWNPVPFDGMTDPFCQALLPFNTLVARAFGPVMVHEFSTILINGRPECESYLNTVLPACLANGANGFLWWCLRDVKAAIHPYNKSGFEGRLGLVDAQDRLKPAAESMMVFLRSLATWTPPAASTAEIAVYWPQEFYRRENPYNPGNDPSAVWRRALAWYYMLGRLGRPVQIARAGVPLDPSIRILIVAGAALTAGESAQVEAWVRQGGRVIWSGPTWQQWTESVDATIGAVPVDIRASRPATVACFGGEWTLHSPSEGRAEVRLTTATVRAARADGQPVILENGLGKGRAVTVLPLAEEGLLSVAADRVARDHWQDWFAGLLGLVEGRG
jgi:hypothetical protein